jgi:hypothetical protein
MAAIVITCPERQDHWCATAYCRQWNEPRYLACLTCSAVTELYLLVGFGRLQLRNFWSRDPRGPPMALSATWSPCGYHRTDRYVIGTSRWPDLWAPVPRATVHRRTGPLRHTQAGWMNNLPTAGHTITFLWDMTPCSLVASYRLVGETYGLYLSG